MSRELAYLEGAKAAHAAGSSRYAALAGLLQRKLWHELTLELAAVAAAPEFAPAGGATGAAAAPLAALYRGCVSEFELKLNPLALAHFVVAASKQLPDPTAAGALLDGVATKVPHGPEAALLLDAHSALLLLQGPRAVDAKARVDECTSLLAALSDPDPAVSAAVHMAAALQHKASRDYAGFYKAALLYLGYASASALDPTARLALAVDLGLAALLGEGVYSFGELLSHPVASALVGTTFAWLHDLLVAFEAGDLAAYDAACARHRAALYAQPALVEHERSLREKITLMALTRLVFSLPAGERVIPLSRVAAETVLPLPAAEHLLMKALASRLIEGSIDQVAGTVHVTWVQPRVLSLAQVGALRDRLGGWLDRVGAALGAVEAEAAVEAF